MFCFQHHLVLELTVAVEQICNLPCSHHQQLLSLSNSGKKHNCVIHFMRIMISFNEDSRYILENIVLIFVSGVFSFLSFIDIYI